MRSVYRSPNLFRLGGGRAADLAGPEAVGPRLGLTVELDVMPRLHPAGVAAGGHAEDVRGAASEEPHPLPRQPLHLDRVDALPGEDLPLRLRPAGAVVADDPIGADHPVAGDQD